MSAPSRLGVVVLTYNRQRELIRTLRNIVEEVGRTVPVCVVDNGSSDGTADLVAELFPRVQLVRLEQNLGAAGRNAGAWRVSARYVAFCDDDTWWAPGALKRATALLDRYPSLAAVTARVLVGPEEREDPASTCMAQSPLPNSLRIPGGHEVAGILAGACVFRRRAFIAAGGYEPRLFIGGEERLLAIDLMSAGWHLAYLPELVVHHHPSSLRDSAARQLFLVRNALWCAWLRRPLPAASRETGRQVAALLRDPAQLPALFWALQGLPWALRNRRVVPPRVEFLLRLLDEESAA